MRQLGGSIPTEVIDPLRLEAIQRLLGDTIKLSDATWRGPSLLPGWTRAHVATHLARNAELMLELTEASLTGREPDLPTEEERFAAIERGAERSGLELQIDLDTSAGTLSEAWSRVTDWHRPIHFQGRVQPLAALMLARLHELCVHHLDLDTDFTAEEVGPVAGGWLLAWVLQRLTLSWHRPVIEVQSSSGEQGILGSGTRVVGPVRGSDPELWAWLSGRTGPHGLSGAGNLRLPLLD